MDFLKVSKDDIEKAKSGGMPTFKENEEVRFLVEEVKRNEQKQQLIVALQVLSGENKGKKMSQFIDNNEMGQKKYIAMMLAYHTEDDLASGNCKPEDLLGKKLESIAKMKAGTGANTGKTYTNFYDWKPVSDVPDELAELDEAVETAASNIETEKDAGSAELF